MQSLISVHHIPFETNVLPSDLMCNLCMAKFTSRMFGGGVMETEWGGERVWTSKSLYFLQFGIKHNRLLLQSACYCCGAPLKQCIAALRAVHMTHFLLPRSHLHFLSLAGCLRLEFFSHWLLLDKLVRVAHYRAKWAEKYNHARLPISPHHPGINTYPVTWENAWHLIESPSLFPSWLQGTDIIPG